MAASRFGSDSEIQAFPNSVTVAGEARDMATWAAKHAIRYLDGAIMATPDLIGGPHAMEPVLRAAVHAGHAQDDFAILSRFIK